MRLKKLEIVGFKSFLEKTSFDFQSGLTSIVGPNGCGKSNVVDAIKWVTGELSFKELRGKSMQDLIFAGSELKPPTGMAEVAVTLENDGGSSLPQYAEYPEIHILRRVFRDGTSEYFINKTECRLKDVIDVFLDTGVGESSYSIIEQGRVGAVVAGKPEDRRMMIEEAAGITKYKHRKKAAERKMEYTRQNLMRVGDVLGELKRQIQSLERQARKAEQYKKLTDETKKLDLALSARNFRQLKDNLDQMEASLKLLSHDGEIQHAELTTIGADLEKRRLDSLQAERDYQSAQEALAAESARLSDLDHKVLALEQESRQLKAYVETNQAEAKNVTGLIHELEIRISEAARNAGEMEAQKVALSADLSASAVEEERKAGILKEWESRVEVLNSELLALVAKEAELKNSVSSGQGRASDVAQKLDSRMRELERGTTEFADLEERSRTCQREVGVAVHRREETEQEQARVRAELEKLNELREKTDKELSSLNQKIEGVRSRVEALEEFERTYQGYDEGVRSLMEARAANEGPTGQILGLVGEGLKTKRGFERAVEAALAERIKALVVESPRDALGAIEFLKSSGRGRASFFPAAVRREESGRDVPSDPGVLGKLLDFVEVPNERFSGLRALLSGVLVVENLPRALGLWEAGVAWSMVTPHGDFLTAEGVVSGGSWEEYKGVLQVHGEIEELKEVLARSDSQRKELEQVLLQNREETDTAVMKLAGLVKELETDSQKIFEMEKEIERLKEAVERCRQSIVTIRDEQSVMASEAERFEDGIREATLSLTQTGDNRTGVERGLREAVAKREQANGGLAEFRAKLTEKKVAFASLDERVGSIHRERETLTTQLETHARQRDRLIEQAESERNRGISLENERDLAVVERNRATETHQQREREARDVRSKYDLLSQETQTLLGDEKVLREKAEMFGEKLTDLRLKLNEEKARIEVLESQIQERHRISLSAIVSSPEYEEMEDELAIEAEGELTRLREKIAKVGDVHLGAIDELKELTDRQLFLSSHKGDLERTLDSLRQAIGEINSTTKERFQRTFADVNTKFQEIFPKLFRGGKAHLVLSDPENLLESGVEIVAQPPGKRLQNLNLLSGGEKALTAIGLLFAIFLHKAPPFCVLDEVDAPLDDQNVKRFLGLVKGMSQNTQFILITHNKLSMEEAETLYGVTMEEPGVSRVVSVRVNQWAQEQVLPAVVNL